MCKDDAIIGAVVTFLDITERKRNEEKMQYLCHHDSLTGLMNRHRFKVEMQYFDEEEYLPLSIIYCDLNGLKLANDIFGHEEGDNLICQVANSLTAICRKGDIVARIGGDEFVWLLPNTDAQSVKRIMERVKFRLMWNSSSIIKCSMAMGASTRNNMNKSLVDILKTAENEMYLEKSAVRNEYEEETLDDLIKRLHDSNPYDKSHSENVSLLCKEMGMALRWPKDKVTNLKDAGYYHDIGKIILLKDPSKKNLSKSFIEKAKVNQHPIIGFRIMNMFSNTQDIANSIYFHHERWDGTGYPKGLKGEEIPINSRIIAIAEQYDHYVNQLTDHPRSKEEALMEIQLSSGTKFDPMLAELFVLTQGRPAGVLSGINLSGRLSE
jgi:diguanylate cyclase (GGDEF)-like protein